VEQGVVKANGLKALSTSFMISRYTRQRGAAKRGPRVAGSLVTCSSTPVGCSSRRCP